MKNLSYKDKKEIELIQVIERFKGNEAASAYAGANLSAEGAMQLAISACERLSRVMDASAKGRAKNRSKD